MINSDNHTTAKKQLGISPNENSEINLAGKDFKRLFFNVIDQKLFLIFIIIKLYMQTGQSMSDI